MTAATLSPKRPPVFLSQADISAFLSQLAIAEMDAAADRARLARDAAADRARDARLAAIAEMDAELDRVAAADEAILVIRRANEAAVESLRREVIGDPVRRSRDARILAACRSARAINVVDRRVRLA
jgi:hypothetical protein